jgi:hypothetical protein
MTRLISFYFTSTVQQQQNDILAIRFQFLETYNPKGRLISLISLISYTYI